MKVVHLSGNFFPSLVSNHSTKAIWSNLSKGFAEYHIFARSDDQSWHTEREGNIILHRLPKIINSSLIFIISSFLFFREVKKIKPDVIVSQCPVAGGLFATVYSALFKVPVLIELHGEHYFQFKKNRFLSNIILANIFSFFVKLSLKRATSIRALSPSMMEGICETYGSNLLSKIVVVPPRVDTRIFRYRKGQPETSSQCINIVTIGALTKLKNHSQLLKDLVSTRKRFDLTIIGDGPERVKLQEMIDRADLNQSVRLAGKLSHQEIYTKLASTDIYIHYSTTEALPRVILEAMAVGVPVITTRVGFLTGFFEHELDLLYIDGGTRNDKSVGKALMQLERAIWWVQNNPTNVKSMTANAYRKINEWFESSRNYNEYIGLIRRTAETSSR